MITQELFFDLLQKIFNQATRSWDYELDDECYKYGVNDLHIIFQGYKQARISLITNKKITEEIIYLIDGVILFIKDDAGKLITIQDTINILLGWKNKINKLKNFT